MKDFNSHKSPLTFIVFAFFSSLYVSNSLLSQDVLSQRRLIVENLNAEVARFHSLDGRTYITIYEEGIYRGYLGSFSGNDPDVDFGTGTGNNLGKLHLTIQAEPKFTLDTEGKVGIGTVSPLQKLHVVGNQFVEGNVGIGTESPDEPLSFQGTLGPKINLFDGSGIYGFGMAPAELQIGTFDDTKHISLGHFSGSSKTFVEWMEVNTNSLTMTKSGAYVTSGGVWTDASSRSFKENISKLTLEEATLTLAELTPVKFNYKLQKDEEYIGFIAEDVPQLVATKDRKGLSPMDIVAVLTRVVQKQQSEIADLKGQTSEMNNLKREMAELKSLLNAQIKNLSEE